MFNFKTKLLSAIFACLLFASPASAEFFSDVILTGTNGIWVDSRSYASLQAAVTAVGGADREIVIIGAQGTVNLAIPANVRLKFLRDGSINNTGQLTINTRNIVAEDRQIFTGTGDIDFIDGSVVRSSWFSNAVEALDVTLDDTLTMVISETGRITANSAVGNNVSLKWESSDNRLIVYGGRVLSNVKNLEAGNYQIFAGAGDIDFLDGTELYLSWFRRLRSVLTWIEAEEVTIFVTEDSTVEYTQASTANENIKFISGNTLAIPAGITLTLNGTTETAFNSFDLNATAVLTINGPLKGKDIIYTDLGTLNINGSFECGLYRVFPGTGTIAFGDSTVTVLYPQWWGATGDGITDDTVAIQTALDTLINAQPATIELPHGTYMISGVDMWGETTLQGISMRNSVLKMIANSDTDMIVEKAPGSALSKILNLTLDGNGANQASGCGIKLTQANIWTLQDIKVFDCKEQGLYLDTCNLIKVRDCLITENLAGGVYATNSEECNLTDCDIETNQAYQITMGVGIAGSVNRITGCWFENAAGDTITDQVILGSNGTIITGCRFNSTQCSNSAINILTGVKQNTLIGNSFINSPGNISILIDSGATSNVSISNLGGTPVTTDNDGNNFIREHTGLYGGFGYSCLVRRGIEVQPFITFTDTDATPSVAHGNNFRTGNTGATDVTFFDDNKPGQLLYIVGLDGGNTTVKHDITKIFMAGGADFILGDRDVLVLIGDGSRLYEVSRSNN